MPGANEIGEGGHSINKSISIHQRMYMPREVIPFLRPYGRYGSDIKALDKYAIGLS